MDTGLSAVWRAAFYHTKNLLKEGFTMKEFWNTIQLIFAGVGGWLGWFLGGCDGLLYERKEKGILERQGGFGCTQADGEPHDERNARRKHPRRKGGGWQCLM